MDYLKLTLSFLICNLVSVNTVLANTDPIPGPGAAPKGELKNPLSVNSIEGLLEALLAVVVVLAIPVIVFFIIYAGFLYVTARGNASQVEEATRALTYAIIGGVLVIGATAIVTIVKNFVLSF